MEHLFADLSIAVDAEADVRSHSNGDYHAVNVDTFRAGASVTLRLSLPKDPEARARIAGALAREFAKVEAAAFDAMIATETTAPTCNAAKCTLPLGHAEPHELREAAEVA